MTIEVIPRSAWKARPPRRRHTIALPTPELWLHHTVSASNGAATVRAIQNDHMDNKDPGWSDIGYTRLVDRRSLAIYEGRGPGIAGGHTKGHNTTSHGIAVMGNFNEDPVSPALILVLAEIAADGYLQGWWPPGFTGGHRETRGNNVDDCPGNALQASIPAINEQVKRIIRERGSVARFTEKWQAHLVAQGHDLGTSGPGGDGVDDDFGEKTYNASMAESERAPIPSDWPDWLPGFINWVAD